MNSACNDLGATGAIKISAAAEHTMRSAAEQAYPRECCGILLGIRDDGELIVQAVLACANEENRRNDRYSIPAAELIAAQKRARNSGTDIIGFYHSHPDHPPQPSSTDLAEAHWFNCVYLIVTVHPGGAAEMRAFILEGDEQQKRLSEIEIRVEP